MLSIISSWIINEVLHKDFSLFSQGNFSFFFFLKDQQGKQNLEKSKPNEYPKILYFQPSFLTSHSDENIEKIALSYFNVT